MKTEDLYKKYILPTYAVPSLFLEKGKGSRVWDENGNAYLDLSSGIGVTSLGHGHPRWVKRLRQQAADLTHVSNLYGNRQQGELARRLVEKAGPGKCFFCNSGAEANEALIKLARLYGKKKAEPNEPAPYRIVCATNAFHGRTMGGLSATPKPKIQEGFDPLLPGFRFAEWNNLKSFQQAVNYQTTAIMVETIQGEGGVHPADLEFLKGLRKLCDEWEILLILDEVQCGVGRTGRFFAFEHARVKPDAIGMAKGLGGGFPIGAIWVSQKFADCFKPGSHGSTFGGTPLACAAALATLDVIDDLGLLEKVTRRGKFLMRHLRALRRKFPKIIKEVRGRGYMIGLQLSIPVAQVIAKARAKGLIVISAGDHVLRILPPLTIKPSEIVEAIDILDIVFTEIATNPKKS